MAVPRAAYNVIIGGILLHLSLGTLYSWGCIQPYVTSYIRLYDASVTTQETTMVYACVSLGHSLASPLVGLLQFRLGLRGCAMVGVALVVTSMLGCSQAKTVAELSVLYSIFGVGIATAYTCPLVCGYAWMPDRKGMVSGFIVAGFGAGAAVFDIVATAVVNPGNASPDPTTGYYGKDVAGRVPLMFIVLGTCYLLLGMVGSSMISPPPLGSLAQGSAGTYSKLASAGGSDSDESVSASGGAFTSLGNSVHQDRFDDNTEPQEQGSTPRRHTIGAGRSESVETEAVTEGWQTGHNDPEARTVTSLLPSPPPLPGIQGNGKLEEQPDTDMGSPTKSATASVDDGCTSSHGAAHVKGGGGGGATSQRQFKVLELLGEWDYYHLALSMLLTSVSGLYIAGNYKRIAQQSFTGGDRFLSILGSVASLCNASGRIIGGLSVDRFGCFPTLVVMSMTISCALLSLGLIEATRPSFFAIVCLVHLLYGSNFAIYPTLSAEFFGITTAGPNFGLVFMAFGVGAFVSMLCLARFNQSSQVFLVCAGFSLTGASSVALLWLRRKRRGLLTRQLR